MSTLGFRNPAVQRLRRLVNRRSAREEEGCFVIEGRKLLAEAVMAGATIEAVYLDATEASVRDRDQADLARRSGASLHELDPGVAARVGASVAPPPLLAVVRAVDVPLRAVGRQRPDLVVVAVEVTDPGNAGSLIRIAGAAGAGAVICSGGSVDVYNPKTVRASAGALFHVAVVSAVDAKEALAHLGEWGLRRWATSPRSGLAPGSADLRAPAAFVFGNESRGLPEGLEASVDGTLTIPMASHMESLGVAQAAAVICFEAARQRSSVGAPGLA